MRDYVPGGRFDVMKAQRKMDDGVGVRASEAELASGPAGKVLSSPRRRRPRPAGPSPFPAETDAAGAAREISRPAGKQPKGPSRHPLPSFLRRL